MQVHVAIIGAGIAGLAAARVLTQAGVACTLFDKSRGVGGRMSTRRVDDLQFDHGAQYFSAKGERFASLARAWTDAGVVSEWFEGAFVGTPGMTAPARALAAGLEIVTACEVRALRRTREGWTLFTAQGAVEHPANGTFSAVLLALPAPQIEPILASAALGFEALSSVRYAPCWALMLACETRIDLPWTHLRAEGADVPWIARNATKPARGGARETFVVHAGADWSRRFLEKTPEEAAALLLPAFRSMTGVNGEPVYVAAHRWRFALVEANAGAPFLWNDDARIGACGDWCIGARVESAFDSGEAMGRACLAETGARHV
jgi:predicted NAD/FAD-dependent oxidoreductase